MCIYQPFSAIPTWPIDTHTQWHKKNTKIHVFRRVFFLLLVFFSRIWFLKPLSIFCIRFLSFWVSVSLSATECPHFKTQIPMSLRLSALTRCMDAIWIPQNSTTLRAQPMYQTNPSRKIQFFSFYFPVFSPKFGIFPRILHLGFWFLFWFFMKEIHTGIHLPHSVISWKLALVISNFWGLFWCISPAFLN